MTMVVHLSADYPDTIQPNKTRAIAALVEGTRGHLDHRVYSLNRVMGTDALLRPGRLAIASDDGELASCTYAGAPGALFLPRAMARVARSIAEDLNRRGMKPDVVHGHKLSFEGLAARELAETLGCPYVLTLQGNTDQKLLRSRPDLRTAWRAAWRDAAHVFAFAPWIGKWCEAELGPRPTPVDPLPCLLASDNMIAPIDTPPIVKTAFRLDDWRNKNIAALVNACALVRRTHPDLRLEIAGGGSAQSEQTIDHLIARAELTDCAIRVGALPPEHIQDWMNGAAVFALPSRRETFGMVFVEALLAGCPIVYPKGAAVDGYFDGAPFAISAVAEDPVSVARGLRTALSDIASRKAALGAWQASGGTKRFTSASILAHYRSAISKVVG